MRLSSAPARVPAPFARREDAASCLRHIAPLRAVCHPSPLSASVPDARFRPFGCAAKLILISSNCPPLRKSEIEYYAMLAKTSVHHYSGSTHTPQPRHTDMHALLLWPGAAAGCCLAGARAAVSCVAISRSLAARQPDGGVGWRRSSASGGSPHAAAKARPGPPFSSRARILCPCPPLTQSPPRPCAQTTSPSARPAARCTALPFSRSRTLATRTSSGPSPRRRRRERFDVAARTARGFAALLGWRLPSQTDMSRVRHSLPHRPAPERSREAARGSAYALCVLRLESRGLKNKLRCMAMGRPCATPTNKRVSA